MFPRLVGWLDFPPIDEALEQCTLLYNFCWMDVVVLSAGCKEMVLTLVWGLVFPLFFTILILFFMEKNTEYICVFQVEVTE